MTINNVENSVTPTWRRVLQRLRQAQDQLRLAESAADGADTLRHAHLSALRTAHALVLALGGQPKRGRSRSTWEQLSAVSNICPEERAYFEQAARYRDLWESGLAEVDPERRQRHKDMAYQFLEQASALVESLMSEENSATYDLAS